MGKYKDGINGSFRGTIGKVVGSTALGTDYMRSLPDGTKREPSEKQINQRHIFAMVSSWLKPIRTIINVGFQLLANKKTPMNIAQRLLLTQALKTDDGVTSIDYKNVILSQGELLISFITEVICLIDALLHLKWKNVNASLLSNDNDHATFIVYNPSKDKFATFVAEANRNDEQVNLQLPASFTGDAVHCWMQYVSAEGDRVSSSSYLGEVLVG